MFLEDTQKINKLAKELMNHRIAQTSDEAIRMAEEMVKGTKTPEGAELERKQEQESMEIRKLNAALTYLNRALEETKLEIAKLRDELAEHGKIVNRLQFQQENAKRADAAANNSNNSGVANNSSSMAANNSDNGSNNNERGKETGKQKQEFKPEDVAIEKIFYFGQK